MGFLARFRQAICRAKGKAGGGAKDNESLLTREVTHQMVSVDGMGTEMWFDNDDAQ